MRVMLFVLWWPFALFAQGDFPSQIENHRKSYTVQLLQGPNAPLSAQDVARLQFFPPDSSFRITGTFSRLEGEQPFNMASLSGKTEEYIAFGRFTFSYRGQEHHLTLYRKLSHIRSPLFRDLLFVPFRDETNGDSTYGGGRYLDIRMANIRSNRLTLDFNLAYNPYCVYGPGYSCPRPPAENILPFPVTAGEKMLADSKSKD